MGMAKVKPGGCAVARNPGGAVEGEPRGCGWMGRRAHDERSCRGVGDVCYINPEPGAEVRVRQARGPLARGAGPRRADIQRTVRRSLSASPEIINPMLASVHRRRRVDRKNILSSPRGLKARAAPSDAEITHEINIFRSDGIDFYEAIFPPPRALSRRWKTRVRQRAPQSERSG